MAPRIFITGITGYIGGQLLHNLLLKHPDYQITGLVRRDEQGDKIATKYPSVQVLKGDLDSHHILVEQAKEADVILQVANSDHNSCVPSLIQGISQGGHGGTLIQVSGCASVCDTSRGYGQLSTKVWDDVKDLAEISSFDHTRVHAITDQLVLREGQKAGVRTAIALPPMVYGTGDGVIKTTSMQLPWLADEIIKRGKAFTVGEGMHCVSTAHVKDVADALVLLTEYALNPSGGKASWGSEGIYYVESGDCIFTDVVESVAKEMNKRGIIATAEVDRLSADEAAQIHPWATMMWGSNIRVCASRLRALGWTPTQRSVFDVLPELSNSNIVRPASIG